MSGVKGEDRTVSGGRVAADLEGRPEESALGSSAKGRHLDRGSHSERL